MKWQSLGLLVAAMLPFAAFAQEAPAPASTINSILPDMATAPANTVTGYFPALPPSKPCGKTDIDGIWKLVQLYELPKGVETEGFTAKPFQYFFFNNNGTYKESRQTQNISLESIKRNLLIRDEENVLQYVVHESGIIFFYNNSVPSDSLACFIVANPRDQFKIGQMLLMPPANADGSVPAVRLVKVYQKVWNQPGKQAQKVQAAKQAKQTKQAQQAKKKAQAKKNAQQAKSNKNQKSKGKR